jgi:hypothetical protein
MKLIVLLSLYNINLSIAVLFYRSSVFHVSFILVTVAASPILLYTLLKLFFCLVYLFLAVLVCLRTCMLGPDVCVMLEGARSKTLED